MTAKRVHGQDTAYKEGSFVACFLIGCYTLFISQAAVLATLREPATPLAAALPRSTQWPLRIGPQGMLLLDLKIGDPVSWKAS